MGRFDELEIESEVLRDNPLGDPHVRPLWIYVPPAYAAQPDRRFPSIYLIQGMTGQVDMWRNRTAFRPNVPELIDRALREGRLPADARRRGRLLDVVWRLAVHRLARDGPVLRVPLRRGRLLRRLPLPDAGRACSPRTHRQVERRLRRDGRADAAARRLRRTGGPLGRRAVRALLSPGVPGGGARVARRVRRLVRALLGGLPLAARVHEAVRLPARQRVGHGGVLFGERGRNGRAAVRH